MIPRLVGVLAFAAGAALAQDVHVNVAIGNTNSPENILSFGTIQYALDHAAQPGADGRLYVHIAHGNYEERVMITANRPRTTLLGDARDPSAVTITAGQNAKSAGGTFFSATVQVEAPGFEADGVTFANSAGATGQAVALSVRSDKAVIKHCRLLGHQDTLFADFGRQYYVDSEIRGGVDFIFGNAAAVFDRVDIHEQTAGYVTAQSRTALVEATGYVITNSRVIFDGPSGQRFYLGRPWRAFARVVVMHTSLPAELDGRGWSAWREGETPASTFYAEYQNTGPGMNRSGRTWSRELSKQESDAFTPARFLRGPDGWSPADAAGTLP